MAYKRFALMIGTSTLVMFGLMYLNTYLVSHVFWSETRAYMAVVMGAAMAFVMMGFMMGMYRNRAANIAIFIGSIVVFAGALWLVRSQVTVQDRAYMRAMIPHHSIAIMTSTRADISDPRVRRLAGDIVYAQDKEIAQMRYLIADISENGDAAPKGAVQPPQIVDAAHALQSEDVARVDPEFMTHADIAQGFADGPDCAFTYTEASPPVLAVDADGALLRISGDLVRLEPRGEGRFAADPLSVSLTPTDGDLHELLVSAGPQYTAGFHGQYSCTN
ncbi:DUF305 domain-containing protein [Salipiger bermudensis]|uniref:DUF305 domain-containing protein n=1 Tax=Salipiger bermudensis TaxID=344736 RepID=UPI003009329A